MLNIKQSIKKTKFLWDKALSAFGFLSEAANVGIIIEIVAKWWPPLLTVGMGVFGQIVYFSDPAIYFFKSLNRLTRIVGRKVFGIEFEEEKHGLHPWQTVADIFTMGLYIAAIPFFLGVVVSGPIGVTVGWSLGLCGLCVVGYFDYRFQSMRAKEAFHRAEEAFLAKKALENENSSPEFKAELGALEATKNKLYHEYSVKRAAYFLYMGLLLGLACLLICGSAALFAPPAVAPVLFIIAKVATGYLALIAVGRFYNWIRSPKEEVVIKENTLVKAVEVEVPSSTKRILEGLQPEPALKRDSSSDSEPTHSYPLGGARSPSRSPSRSLSRLEVDHRGWGYGCT